MNHIPRMDYFSEKDRDLLLREAGYDINKSLERKRMDYLSWEDYFMAIACLSAKRSKDPLSQVGACIVNSEKKILGIGYNGFPRGCSDDFLPWSKTGKDWLHTKYPYECQADMNAILNKCSADVVGATLFVSKFPCNESAQIIIQSGIREVVYLYDRDREEEMYKASRILLGLANVKYRKYHPTKKNITLDFGEFKNLNSNSSFDPSFENNSLIELKENEIRKKIKEEGIEHDVTQKRQHYLCWDDYFIAIAFLSAQRSKDPNTQVGACIVNSHNRIVGIGYNGFPNNCGDDVLP